MRWRIMLSMMQTTIRWGIIGCGNVTEVKSGPAYQQTQGFELSSVMRRDLSKAQDYATRHKVAHYSNDADELIFNDAIDAIYIATPPDSHKEYALKVAKANKPCCIEKPMAPSYQDSLEINEAFKEKNLPLFVAYYRRSLPRFTHVKTWLESAEIGDLRHVALHLSKPASELDLSKAENWRTNSSIAEGGYFDDLASHGLDLLCFLLGDIREAKGISVNQQKLYSAKDAITACWLHENNVTGSGTWNFGSSVQKDEVVIYGSQGSICFSVFAEQPIVLKNQAGRQELSIEHPKHIQIHHVENIKKHLADEQTHPSTGETALHTAWVMDKMLGKL